MAPFIIRSGMLFTFQNVNIDGNPFTYMTGSDKKQDSYLWSPAVLVSAHHPSSRCPEYPPVIH